MGQKVNPTGFRVSVTKNWRSRWFADKKSFGTLLHEDNKIRDLVKERLKDAAVSEILIERYANRARVSVFTARPGIVIGRKGAELEKLRADLAKTTGKEIYVEIKEIKDPDCNAQLVAENIALQLERRVSFRRALKRSVQMAMELGAQGIRVHSSGRLGGSELARREGYREGKVPLHTLRANVQYGFAEANTMAGKIGIKVWICKAPEAPVKEASRAAYA
ncbi:MAG: 30S ribosomal protein S3 [Kiritimatiellae bacterium]|nr:30S ribosomal protein S3 [Kiritimatiellia bacterium]MCO5044637.1 30S ribosomal protein S3 [Kiritimatiellia bacterium]MCO5060934.1 30S ribosomal protein S3 [Kiritimatiellia bacterium]MCO5068151.1 30S ribosomal protein S3 [Kiritimatiellia bacterium]MCO6400829.1 30S ribosomal protein S3 [Verrucomicrobiota bacterium]